MASSNVPGDDASVLEGLREEATLQSGLLKSIEAHTGSTMAELEVDDARVAEILVQVNTARREADIKLEEKDWGQAKQTNKRKKLILDGRDPDAEERKRRKFKKNLSMPSSGYSMKLHKVLSGPHVLHTGKEP